MTTENSTNNTVENTNINSNGGAVDKTIHDGGLDANRRPSVDVPAGSRLHELKLERDKLVAKEEIRLPIPTWKKRLVGVFRPLTIDEREEFSRKMEARTDDDGLSYTSQFIADCCRGIEILNDDGKYEPVILSDGTQAVMNKKFAEELGNPHCFTGSSCVQFLVNFNVSAISALFEKLHEWSKDTSLEVEGAILGE